MIIKLLVAFGVLTVVALMTMAVALTLFRLRGLGFR